MSHEFTCLACGQCCNNIGDKDGSFGLFIFPNERQCFPKNSVQPCLGKGKTPTHRDFIIVAYQLVDRKCPNLQENKCKIYSNRPLACKAFPYSLRYFVVGAPDQVNVSLGCKFISLTREKGIFYKNMKGFENDSIIAAKRIGNWMINWKQRSKKKDIPWEFSLLTREWEPFKLTSSRY